MLTAKINNNLINCYDGKYSKEELKAWASKDIIKCPVCGKSYEYCHGQINTPYFRHKDKAECDYLYSEPETEEHIKGKIALYEWIKQQDGVTNAILEAWLPKTKQRPDIMFEYGGDKWVIEFQCSPIATEQIERHRLYEAAGIKDFWICGTEEYFKNYINKETGGVDLSLRTTVCLHLYLWASSQIIDVNIIRQKVVNAIATAVNNEIEQYWIYKNKLYWL